MTKHDPFVRLHHMLDYSREAVEMGRGKSAKEISEDRQLGLALTHLIELIGEAASHIPREIQSRYPQIPWSKVIGTRHRLIHGYDLVDFDILRDTITNDLPPLIEALGRILAAEDKS